MAMSPNKPSFVRHLPVALCIQRNINKRTTKLLAQLNFAKKTLKAHKITSIMSRRFMDTSGVTDPVWVHRMPFDEYLQFPGLDRSITTDVCVIGSGIAGISTAYELVRRGKNVVMLEARHVLSGESSRTSGHLSSDLDDGYFEIQRKHGWEGAKMAAESHSWAVSRVGEIAHALGIDCEYRRVPAYEFSQCERKELQHELEVHSLKGEVETAQKLGLNATFHEGLAVQGWDGKPDQRDGAVFHDQATFHPTRYMLGVLGWLKQQSNFRCFTHTEMVSMDEYDIVQVHTANGLSVLAGDVVEATCVPLQKLSIIAEMEYSRTYCIAIRVPRGSVEDCLIYDQADAYKYVRLTQCDNTDDYMVVGGCDHKVGQAQTDGQFHELETWARERFPQAGAVDYRWSGQVYEPADYMAFIGKNQGRSRSYVVTGDSGDGLTHGVLAGRLLADEIEGIKNPWMRLYKPSRMGSMARAMSTMLQHDAEINTQYKRYFHPDIKDIEDLAVNTGGVLHDHLMSKPVAVYKDGEGQTYRFSAVCPHMKGVLCWNATEKSWDCPVHGSRFSGEGIRVEGPAKSNLTPIDDTSGRRQAAGVAV